MINHVAACVQYVLITHQATRLELGDLSEFAVTEFCITDKTNGDHIGACFHFGNDVDSSSGSFGKKANVINQAALIQGAHIIV